MVDRGSIIEREISDVKETIYVPVKFDNEIPFYK